jgi:GxxExxY protein
VRILQRSAAHNAKPTAKPNGTLLASSSRVLIGDARLNALTHRILGAAIEVHRVLGPGLLESIYLVCFEFELSQAGLAFVRQETVPIVYKSQRLACTYRVDLIVEDRVIVEVKAVDALLPVFEAQLLTYLRLKECPLGLLINFNVPRLMQGVKRRINPRMQVR